LPEFPAITIGFLGFSCFGRLKYENSVILITFAFQGKVWLFAGMENGAGQN
jgi:hypothetical protein